jgi:leucyl/phenylalanyl-tRNA--protein transferase
MIYLPDIIEGYAKGYFLMADDNGNLEWFKSRQRAIIPLEEGFRYPKSLRRVLNQNRFSTAINRDFLAVCQGCANRETTWISPQLIEVYLALHQAGFAYSFETWQDDQLAGGLLGIAFGGVFIGESMFYQIPEGSKVAMVKLVEHLKNRGFILFDVQMQNPHLQRFGAYIIKDQEYQYLLQKALKINCNFS